MASHIPLVENDHVIGLDGKPLARRLVVVAVRATGAGTDAGAGAGAGESLPPHATGSADAATSENRSDTRTRAASMVRESGRVMRAFSSVAVGAFSAD
jgi:hypothetical protein